MKTRNLIEFCASRHPILAAFGALLLSSAALAAVDVSPAGAATYRKPIGVPPGASGSSPMLALEYASSNPEASPFGFGWSLKGISAISRCDSIPELDNAPRATFKHDPNDKLCLDGERLIPTGVDGSAPQVGAATGDSLGLASGAFTEFRTETEPYARIRAYGTADGTNPASGPAYFKVWTKDGRVLTFGPDPAFEVSPMLPSRSHVKAYYPAGQSTQYAQMWLISRAIDRSGNYVDYKYDRQDVAWGSTTTFQHGHEWWVQEIQYNGNKVVFAYESRPVTSPRDASEAYHYGAKNVSTRRLKSITTYINSNNWADFGPAAAAVAVKTYNVAYDQGPVTKRSRLLQITECAGGPTSTKCEAPATFAYSAGAGDAYANHGGFNLGGILLDSFGAGSPSEYTSTTALDMNGDGKTDLVTSNPHGVAVRYSNGDGTFSANNAYDGVVANPSLGPCGYLTAISDINSDGLPDIVRYPYPDYVARDAVDGTPLPNQCPDLSTSEIHLNNGTNAAFTRIVVPSLFGGMQSWRAPPNNPESEPPGRDGKTLYLLDVDSDGLVDAVTTSTSGVTRVYKGNATGSFAEITSNLLNQSLYSFGANVRGLSNLVDMDGDGNLDILVSDIPYHVWSPATPGVRIARSRGDGNFDLFTGPSCPGGTTCGAVALDYNGSGRSSLVFAGNPGPSANKLYLADTGAASMSAVTNFNLTTSTDGLVPVQGLASSRDTQFHAVDINLDGRTDILRVDSAASNNVLYLSNGDGTFTPSSTSNLQTFSLAGAARAAMNGSLVRRELLFGDFLGKRQVDILRIGTTTLDSTPTVISNALLTKTVVEQPDLLTSMTDEQGAVTNIKFASPSDASFAGNQYGSRYSSDRGTAQTAIGQQVDLTPSGMVVVFVESDSGVGTLMNATEFSYQGYKVHRKGRGELGFRKLARQAPGADGAPVTLVTEYAQTHPHVGSVAATTAYKGTLSELSAGNALTTSVNLYCDEVSGTGAANAALSSGVHCTSSAVLKKPYLLRSVQSGKDLGGEALPTATTTQSVNAHGEPLTINTTATTGSASDTFSKAVTNEYFPPDTSCTDISTCQWKVALLQRRVTAGVAPGTVPATALATAPGLTLTGCVASGPQQTPTPATYTCTLGNTGSTGASVTYGLTVPSASVAGPSTCLARTANCGAVVITSSSAAGSYAGALTAAPNVGATASVSGITLSVQTPGATLGLPSFANTTVGNTTTAAAMLTNTGVGALSLTPPSASSVSGLAFSFVSTNCGSSLTAGASCQTVVQFFPTMKGTSTGTLSISTSAGEKTVNLSGVGLQGTATPSPSSLTFAAQQTGTTSAGQNVTLTNTGDAPLIVSSVSAGSSEFSRTTNCVTTLAVNASCTITVSFTPAGAGTRTGSFSVAGSSSTGTVSLPVSGSGIVPSATNGQPLSFSHNVPQNTGSGSYVDVVNNGELPVTVNSMSYTTTSGSFNAWMAAAGNGQVGGYCAPGFVLQPGQACGAWANADGANNSVHSGTVTFNTTGGNVTYSGTLNVKGLTYSGATGATTPPNGGQTPALYTMTIGNPTQFNYYFPMYTVYGGAARVGRFSTGSPSNFVITATSCGGTLPAGSSCTVSISGYAVVILQTISSAFQPNGTFQQTGSGSAGAWSPGGWLANMGTTTADVYVSPTNPVNVTPTTSTAILTSAAPSFSAGWYGMAPLTTNVTFQNTGNATLNLTGLTGLNTSRFSISSNGCTNVAPGASCTLTLSQLTSAASSGANSVTTEGVPAGYGSTFNITGTVASAVSRWSNASLAFGTVNVGSSSTQNLTLYNDGANANIYWGSALANLPAGFSADTSACGSVAPGGSCTVSITFTPTAQTSYSGSSIYPSNTSYTNNTLSVSGTGVVPAAQKFGITSATVTTTAQYYIRDYTFTNPNANASALTSFGASPGNPYNVQQTGTTCSAGLSVAAGGSCVYRVRHNRDCVSTTATIAATNAGGTQSSNYTVNGSSTGYLCR